MLLLFMLARTSVTQAAEKISAADSLILSKFFESILECEAGYVFYDKKPLCIIEYSQDSVYFEPREFHKWSTAIYVAKEILKKPVFQSGNIVFYFDEKDETLVIINKKKFIDNIKKNQVLFQYVLGPTITPELLLKEICFSGRSFCEVLKYDRVLIGIMLGYGVENSLYGARSENILFDLVTNQDSPPFISNISLYPTDSQKEDLLFFQQNPRYLWMKNRSFLNPTLGFSSLQEELEAIEARLEVSSEKLKAPPFFIFASLKDSKENDPLISELETCQDEIKALLKSPSFLENVLALVSDEEIEIEAFKASSPFEHHSVNLNVAIAKLLRRGMKMYEKEYIPEFAKGLKGRVDKDQLAKKFRLYPSAVKIMQEAKSNLEESNRYFTNLQKNRNCKKLLESYLYYSVINEGKGPSLDGGSEIVIDYEIFDPLGASLSCAFNQKVNLKDVIPAFSHGLQGMKVGEKRTLYIHPSLAYGLHTYLKKGIYLKAVVTLHEVDTKVQFDLPSLEPQDLSYVLKDSFQNKCDQGHRRALQFMGSQKRESLLSLPGLDMEAIAEAFDSMDLPDSLTQEESDAINQYFWSFYFGL